MSRLVEFFYPLPAPRRTAGAVFRWWEARRLDYNLIVGAAGCATIVATTLIQVLPGNSGLPPWPMIIAGTVAYGLLANLCYLLGPLIEITMYRMWGREAPRAGPALFRQGLLFSIGLTLFPIALAGLGWILHLFARLLA
jgi:hypothetical protein